MFVQLAGIAKISNGTEFHKNRIAIKRIPKGIDSGGY